MHDQSLDDGFGRDPDDGCWLVRFRDLFVRGWDFAVEGAEAVEGIAALGCWR